MENYTSITLENKTNKEMPALIHFNRKWLIACDDFVIPFAIEAFVRSVWFVASCVVTWMEIPGCYGDTSYIKYFFYAFTGGTFVSICLCVGIFIISSRGSVLQVDKRAYLPKVLYAKCITVIFECAELTFGAWILSQESNLCPQWKIFIESAVACLSLYVLAVIIGVFICYNSMGSPVYWNTENRVNSIKIFKKAEKVWRLRLKFCCCCADVSEEENDFIYIEISTFLASFLSDIDLTPTDILAGLIALSKMHAIKKSKVKFPRDIDAALANNPKPSWMTAENALYFLRVAKSTYGWAAFFSPFYPWKVCTLLSPYRCCKGLFQQSATKEGDPFFCDSVAVEKISGLPNSDVLYASFSNSVHEPTFIVALDHSKKAVIIAIRGTCSISDLITVIDADEMRIQIEDSTDKVKCHRGTLRGALFIKKKISELRILQTAFVENPSYTLVITGHSLGGSIAAILSILLHTDYPDLQCYSYAPLGVLSANGITKTFDFVFSVVVGDDITPRLSACSYKELMREIYTSLENTQFPKYKLLTKAFGHYMKKTLKLSHKTLTNSAFENKQVDIEDEGPVEELQISIEPNEAQVYAPGRILYLKRSNGCDYSWVTGFYFTNIIVSPFMMKDHQPHQIQFALEKCKCSMQKEIVPPLHPDSSNFET